MTVRRIFEATKYEAQEQIQIQDFDTYLTKMGFQTLYGKITDDVKLRILYATFFKFDKAHLALQTYAQWRGTSLPPKETSESLKFLESGAIYTFGRDHRFRPIIVVDVPLLAAKINIDVALLAMTILFEFILKNMMLPGQIESWVVILDLGGLGLTSLPQKALKQIMSYLSSNYRSRMFQCYVVRCPKSITFSWGMIKGMLEEVTVRKISFYNNQTPEPLFAHCNRKQVQTKFGGVHPDQVQQFWPPLKRNSDYLCKNDDPNIIFLRQDQYQSMYKQNALALNKLCMELLTDQEIENKNLQQSQLNINHKQQIEQSQNLLLSSQNFPLCMDNTEQEGGVQKCYSSSIQMIKYQDFRVRSNLYQSSSMLSGLNI